MREVLGKILWLLGKLLKGTLMIGLYSLKAVLGIVNLMVLLFCIVVRVCLVFVKVGTPC